MRTWLRIKRAGLRTSADWWPVALLAIVGALLLNPVTIGQLRPVNAQAAARAKSAISSSQIGKRLVGRWRSVNEAGMPDITFSDDGDIKFTKSSYVSKNNATCSTEDVTGWGIADKTHIFLKSSGTSRLIKVVELRAGPRGRNAGYVLDQDAIELDPVDDSRKIILVKVEVFDGPPVLLVHGINDKAVSDTWAKWYNSDPGAIQVASQGDYTLYFVRSPTHFGSQIPVFLLDYSRVTHDDIVQNSAAIPWSIDELKQICDPKKKRKVKVFLICHSLGGLLARAYMESLGTKDFGVPAYTDPDRQDVLGLCTIGTPHGGSWVLQQPDDYASQHPNLMKVKSMLTGRSGEQMKPSSDFLRDLNAADLPTEPYYSAVVGLYAQTMTGGAVGDLVVSALSQEPYRSPDARGGGESRYQQFKATHDYETTSFKMLSHISTLGGIGETESDDVLDWVKMRYELAVIHGESSK
jgi:pimeloyl-ACP methyl ester carboxylesterase